MLMRILTDSELSESMEDSYGLDYVARYTIPGNCITVASKDPFKKGDVMDLDVVDGLPILMGSVLSPESAPKHGVGFLVPLSTNIPLSADAEYEFEASKGVDILLCRRSIHKRSPLVSYLMMTKAIGPDYRVRGIETNTGDEIVWFVSLIREHEIYGV